MNSKPLIFIVDDDLFFRSYISSVLKMNNFDNIKVFSSGESCINNIALNPDIIILDHDMDGMTGSDVLKYLRKINSKIPVIMVSGREDKALVEEVIKLGALKYIRKDDKLLKKLKDYFSKNYSGLSYA